MAEELDWPIEEIPSEDSVFMRAHRIHFRGGSLAPGVFKPIGAGMSVDWEKYSSAEDTRNRAKKPEENAVLKLPVSGIRNIRPLRVEHTPDLLRKNRAHAEVFDMPEREGLAEKRLLLLRIAEIAISITEGRQ